MAAAKRNEVLRERLGADGVEALEEVIDVRQEKLLTVDQFERRLAETNGDIRELRSDMRVAIADLRIELLKWAVFFWAVQAGTVAAIVTAVR